MTTYPFREKVIFFFTFGVFSVLLFFKFDYSPDDAFIYLKYSRNIAGGSGFSFNAGEPSYGVTSFIWTVFLSLPFLLSVDGFWFAKFFDLTFFFLSVWVLFKLTHFFFEDIRVRILSLCVFMINPWVLRSVFTGMETSLAIFAVLLVFLLYYQGRYYWSFFVASLAFFIRPETMVLLLILFIMFMGERKTEGKKINILIRLSGLVLITLVPLLVYAYFNFGTAIPNTVSGKASLTIDFRAFDQLKHMFMVFSFIQPLEALLAISGLVIALKFRDHRLILPVLWIIGLIALYFFTGASVMARYFLIVYPFILLLAFRFITYVNRSYILYFTVILFFIYSQFVFFRYVKPYCENFTLGVNQCLLPVGKWLEENTTPGSRILVNDVGAIGYSTTRYIIDAAALINRDRNLNRKILSVPVYEKENPHNMLEFIEADYLVEKKSDPKPLDEVGNLKLEFLGRWVFPQMWVFDPNPQYFFIYKVIR